MDELSLEPDVFVVSTAVELWTSWERVVSLSLDGFAATPLVVFWGVDSEQPKKGRNAKSNRVDRLWMFISSQLRQDSIIVERRSFRSNQRTQQGGARGVRNQYREDKARLVLSLGDESQCGFERSDRLALTRLDACRNWDG